jgi:hypothetical protein
MNSYAHALSVVNRTAVTQYAGRWSDMTLTGQWHRLPPNAHEACDLATFAEEFERRSSLATLLLDRQVWLTMARRAREEIARREGTPWTP